VAQGAGPIDDPTSWPARGIYGDPTGAFSTRGAVSPGRDTYGYWAGAAFDPQVTPWRVLDRLEEARADLARRHALAIESVDPGLPMGPPGARTRPGLPPVSPRQNDFRRDHVSPRWTHPAKQPFRSGLFVQLGDGHGIGCEQHLAEILSRELSRTAELFERLMRYPASRC
jgi:hypothetical protein